MPRRGGGTAAVPPRFRGLCGVGGPRAQRGAAAPPGGGAGREVQTPEAVWSVACARIVQWFRRRVVACQRECVKLLLGQSAIPAECVPRASTHRDQVEKLHRMSPHAIATRTHVEPPRDTTECGLPSTSQSSHCWPRLAIILFTTNTLLSRYRPAQLAMQLASDESSFTPGLVMHLSKHVSVSFEMAA